MKDLFTKIRQDPKYATTRILAAIIRRCQCSWLKKKTCIKQKRTHTAMQHLSDFQLLTILTKKLHCK